MPRTLGREGRRAVEPQAVRGEQKLGLSCFVLGLELVRIAEERVPHVAEERVHRLALEAERRNGGGRGRHGHVRELVEEGASSSSRPRWGEALRLRLRQYGVQVKVEHPPVRLLQRRPRAVDPVLVHHHHPHFHPHPRQAKVVVDIEPETEIEARSVQRGVPHSSGVRFLKHLAKMIRRLSRAFEAGCFVMCSFFFVSRSGSGGSRAEQLHSKAKQGQTEDETRERAREKESEKKRGEKKRERGERNSDVGRNQASGMGPCFISS